jgi:hypothetical protein
MHLQSRATGPFERDRPPEFQTSMTKRMKLHSPTKSFVAGLNAHPSIES